MISFQKVFSDNDVQLVVDLANKIWYEHYAPIIGEEQVNYMLSNFQSQEIIQEQIDNNTNYYLIYRQTEAIGYLAFEIKEENGFLSKLYLLKEFQKEGIGRQSVQFIVESLIRKSCKRISLQVNKDNTNSINFYKNQGFEILKPIIVDIGNGFFMDDYLMDLELVNDIE